jgi:hypothetical protein
MTPGPAVVIVGGGAAGFFAAITCAETFPRARVTLLEAGREFLSKVRISGGGRCNVTHHCFDPAQLVQNYPRGGQALRGALSRFQPRDTVAWFQARGVALKTEADGRMFPVTDSSQTIVDCLFQAAQARGVRLRNQSPVRQILKTAGPFQLLLKNGERLTADRVLIATGSHPLGYQWAQGLGHTILPPVPSLFTLQLRDPRLADLAGISVEPVQLSLVSGNKTKLEQTGPLLITHWGLSGPAVLKLSAWGARCLHDHHYRLPLVINWLPHYSQEQIRQVLLATKQDQARKQLQGFSPLPLPKRLWQNLAKFADIGPMTTWAEVSKTQIQALVQTLNQGQYQVQGKGVFKEEFVTCGGVSLKEINFKTMESRPCPGLFFAGEILDIDGITGGFNFQNAWTTGWLAGQHLGIQG